LSPRLIACLIEASSAVDSAVLEQPLRAMGNVQYCPPQVLKMAEDRERGGRQKMRLKVRISVKQGNAFLTPKSVFAGQTSCTTQRIGVTKECCLRGLHEEVTNEGAAGKDVERAILSHST
jgi:hypothetical protein